MHSKKKKKWLSSYSWEVKGEILCLLWLKVLSLHSQLNDAFTVYKKEKAENDRMLNETNDRLQKQIHEFQSSQAKMTAQLEFSNKRYIKWIMMSK